MWCFGVVTYKERKDIRMKKLMVLVLGLGMCYLGYRMYASDKVGLKDSISLVEETRMDVLDAKVMEVEQVIASTAKYRSDLGFFIDMRIPSMQNRFFIYDLKQHKIIDRGLVAHGVGSETGIGGKLQFSNIENSLSSSLGNYAVGISYYGQFGKAYKLHGLDATNSNAFARHIVLHKYAAVPYEEQSSYICNSYGCPMVNERFYSRIEQLLDASEKHVIMCIYY